MYMEKLLSLRSSYTHGLGWGLSFDWMSKIGFFKKGVPFITSSAYGIEVLFYLYTLTNKDIYMDYILSSLDFLEKDLQVLFESDRYLVKTYSIFKENRMVFNSNSYLMYLYSLYYKYKITKKPEIFLEKAEKIFNWLADFQNTDGSWFFFNDNLPGNFIDCFHHCFILKNIWKSSRILGPESGVIFNKGFGFLKSFFAHPKSKFLPLRFVISDRIILVKFDLYDAAEYFNLLVLTGRIKTAEKVLNAILRMFSDRRGNLYSKINIFGFKTCKWNLRWGIMPLFLAYSNYLLKKNKLKLFHEID